MFCSMGFQQSRTVPQILQSSQAFTHAKGIFQELYDDIILTTTRAVHSLWASMRESVPNLQGRL